MAEKITRELVIKGNADSAVRAVNQAETALKDLSKTAEKQRDLYRDSFGDLSSGAASIASVLGGSAVGEAFAGIGDLSGAAEYSQRLAESVGDLAKRTAESVPAIGSLSSGFQAAIPALGATGAGLAAVATAALPIAAVVGAAALAFNRLQQDAKGASDALNESVNAQREYNELINSDLTTEQAKERLAELEQSAAAENELIDRLQGNREQAFSEASAAYGDFFARLGTSLNEGAGLYNSNTSQIEQSNTALGELNPQIRAYKMALEDNAFAANDATTQTQQNSIEEAKLTAQRDRSIATLAQLQQQEAALIESAKERLKIAEEDQFLSDNRNLQDRAIADRRANQDLLRSQIEQLEQHNDNLVNIAEQGADRVEDLQESVVDAQIDAYKEIDDATKDYGKAISEANEDYYKDAIDDQREFNRARRDIERDFRKDKDSAILENSVLAFEQAEEEKRNASRELRRDEKDANRERENELKDAIKAAEEAQRERLADIQEELSVFQDKTNKEIALTKDQSDKAIAEAEREFQEKQNRDKELRALQNLREEEDLRLRQERLEQDRGIADARADESLKKQLAAIDAKELAEQEALDAFLLKITDIKTAIGTIGNTPATTTAAPPVTPIAPPSAPMLPLPPPTTGGGGGMNQVSSMNRGGRGGGTINTQGMFSGAVFNVGEVVTPTQLQQSVDDIGNGVMIVLEQFAKLAGL